MFSDRLVLNTLHSQPDHLHIQGHFYFVNLIFLPSITVTSCWCLVGHPSSVLCFIHAFLGRKYRIFCSINSSELAVSSSTAPFPFNCFRFASRIPLVTWEGCSHCQPVLSAAYGLMQIGTFKAQADSSCVIQWHFLLRCSAQKRSLKGARNEVTVWGAIQFQPQRQHYTKQ